MDATTTKGDRLTLDDIYSRIGEFGCYQRRVVFIVSLISFSTAFNNLGYVFWAGRPAFHHCRPGVDVEQQLIADNITDFEQILNLTVPWEDGRRSRCLAYDTPDVGNVTWWHDSDVIASMSTTACSRWYYDTSQYKSTIVTLWDLVCDRSWLVSFTQSAYMFGRIVGTQLYGHLLDRFGRRRILLVAILFEVIFAIACAFINNIYLFLVGRFLLGIQTTGELQAAFVIATEMVGPSYRVLATTMIQLYWAVAYMSLAGIAYLLRDRFTLHIVISAPLVLLLSFYWFIPETPRWLLAKGRTKDAVELLHKMAAGNGTVLLSSDASRIQTEENVQRDKRCTSILDLFRTPNICRTSFIVLFIWFVSSFVFYGLSLNATSIGGNDYINFFISGAVEVPAYLLLIPSLARFGRPRLLALSLILAGLFLLFIILVPKDIVPARVALWMGGKASITYSYALIYMYTPEIYPTVIRGIGLGAGAMMARAAGVLAPYSADVAIVWKNLPDVLFGSLSLLAGILSVCLPETKDIPLAQTIEDGEKLAKIKGCPSTCRKRDKTYSVTI